MRKNRFQKGRCCSVLFTAASLIICAALGGCSTPSKSESIKMTGMFFDTVVQIEVWGGNSEILEHCEKICEDYEQRLSPEIDSSEISQINNAGGAPVEVSAETAELIRDGIRYGELSGGKFDITIASAADLWNFTDNPEKTIPDAAALSEAVSHIDYHNVQVDGNTVTLTDPQAQIDLGGIAKGYIADKVKEYLKSKGIEHALINLGGNMLALGGRYDGSPFRVGLQKPFAQSGTVLGSLSVTDRSVVTSGNYERYFEKDGIIYHHILDPDTGYPVENGLDQVSIISDLSVDGDALSTTCFVLGLEKGLELIRSLDGIEAVFVTSDGEIYTSSQDILIEGIN